jgi:hypothetical protein
MHGGGGRVDIIQSITSAIKQNIVLENATVWMDF